MTDITIEPNRIILDGHAGDKTVCAALSALTENFLASMQELTTDKIEQFVISGYVCIGHGDLTEEGILLRRSFLIGLHGVASAAPDNITISQTRR